MLLKQEENPARLLLKPAWDWEFPAVVLLLRPAS